jgi:5'-deoxynucleotidase YfbR-like HD superfamily hydrolase
MGHLKRVPRSGWLLLGVPQPGTIAEHSFRVGIIGMALAVLEGADVGRTSALCLLHDAHETRIGDVFSVGRAYVTTAAPEAVSSHQTAGMPDAAAEAFQELTVDFEAGETVESPVARDADKLETLLQAVEYQTQGHDTTAWQESSIASLRTESAKQLAQAISATDPAVVVRIRCLLSRAACQRRRTHPQPSHLSRIRGVSVSPRIAWSRPLCVCFTYRAQLPYNFHQRAVHGAGGSDERR